MKLNKSYYQSIIEQLSKILLKEKNKIAQKLDREFKEYGYAIGYCTEDLDIRIEFRKKHKKDSDKE